MATFGENLRRERELRGITLLELANATKVTTRHLAALEQDRFDQLPGGVFNRGFVRAVARYMKLNENYWLSEYARAANEELEILEHYTPPVQPSPAFHRGWWSLVALVAVFAMGVFAVHQARLRKAAEAAGITVSSPAPSTQPSPAAPNSTAVPAPADAAPPAQPLPRAAAPALSEPAATPEPSRELRLQVDVVQEVWVSVTVDGKEAFQGQMKPGAPRRFRASARIQVSASDASLVVLTLNGETLPPLGTPGERKSVDLTANDLKPPLP